MKPNVLAISSLYSGINYLPPDEKIFLAKFIYCYGDTWSDVSKADIAKHMKLSSSTVDKMLAKIVHRKTPHEYIVEQKQYVDNGRPRQTYRLSDRFALKVEQYLPWLTRGEKPSGVVDVRRSYDLDNAIQILSAPIRYGRSGIKSVRLTDKNVLVLVFLWLYCETDKPLVRIKLSFLSEKTGLTTTDLKRELAKLKNKQLIYDWVTSASITPSLRLENDLIFLYPSTKLLEYLTGDGNLDSLNSSIRKQEKPENSSHRELKKLLLMISRFRALSSKKVKAIEEGSNNVATLINQIVLHRLEISKILTNIYDNFWSDQKLGFVGNNESALVMHIFEELLNSTVEMESMLFKLLEFYSTYNLHKLVSKEDQDAEVIRAITAEDLIVPISHVGHLPEGLTTDLIENAFSYLLAWSAITPLK